jgi:hypothetical protein
MAPAFRHEQNKSGSKYTTSKIPNPTSTASSVTNRKLPSVCAHGTLILIEKGYSYDNVHNLEEQEPLETSILFMSVWNLP